jgi:hypothetical protein
MFGWFRETDLSNRTKNRGTEGVEFSPLQFKDIVVSAFVLPHTFPLCPHCYTCPGPFCVTIVTLFVVFYMGCVCGYPEIISN